MNTCRLFLFFSSFNFTQLKEKERRTMTTRPSCMTQWLTPVREGQGSAARCRARRCGRGRRGGGRRFQAAIVTMMFDLGLLLLCLMVLGKTEEASIHIFIFFSFLKYL